MSQQDLPGRVPANKDNDLLFRSGMSEEERKRKEEQEKKKGRPMVETGHGGEGPLEYFTE